MGKSLSLLLVGTSLAFLGFANFAQAGTPLTVTTDHSQLITLSADPGTVVIGNPLIADISLNGRQLFINGHGAGETNLMVFDQDGNKLADYEIAVAQGSDNSMILFASGSIPDQRLSYVCAPNCELSMMVGDTSFANILTGNQTKTAAAQGAGTAQAASTAAPTGPH
jgi:Flp pilus assembly secretin CpaC